jgi:basic amino acid/polyamine antiporter, APA family
MTELARRLNLADSVYLVIGSVFGSGIFLTTGLIAGELPSPFLIWLVWLIGGGLTIFGAMTYAELGTLFPGAGGPYVYLRQAYGAGAGFLYGWTFFWIIGSAGVAALAMGFAEYLGALVPSLSLSRPIFAGSLGPISLSLSAGHLVAVGSIAALSALNYFGIQSGARFQNGMVILRLAALAAFIVLGFVVGAGSGGTNLRPFLPRGPLPSLPHFGAALLAVLWTYDGWYSVNCTAEEVRDPHRTLPRALLLGTLAVTGLYLLANVVYSLALPVGRMQGVVRIGEQAAVSLFGPGAGRLFAALVAAATLGCLGANILFCPRVSFAMARDGMFFRRLAYVHPRFRVPTTAILAQAVWAGLLCLSGTYQSLIEFVTFVLVLFFAATGFSVIVLRRKAPGLERPYRAWGYPWLPGLYVLVNLVILAAVLFSRPVQALAGAGFVLAGVPAYLFWRSRGLAAKSAALEGDPR